MRVSFDKSISSLAVEITEAERNYLGGRRIKVLLDEIGHGRVRLVPSENTQGYLLSENVKKHEKVYRSQIALHDEKARIMDRLAPQSFSLCTCITEEVPVHNLNTLIGRLPCPEERPARIRRNRKSGLRSHIPVPSHVPVPSVTMNLDGPFLVELVKNYIDQNHSDVFGKRNKDYEVYVSKALDPIKVKRL